MCQHTEVDHLPGALLMLSYLVIRDVVVKIGGVVRKKLATKLNKSVDNIKSYWARK